MADRIDLCVEVSKKIAMILKDPTSGKEMTAEERNKKRGEAFDDINTCIDVLAAIAGASEAVSDMLELRNKYGNI